MARANNESDVLTIGTMRTCEFTMVGMAPLVWGRMLVPDEIEEITNPRGSENASKMSGRDKEEALWKHRVHRDEKGSLAFPSICVYKSLCWAGKWLAMKIPGEGKKTYTARIVSGVSPYGGSMMTVLDHEGQPIQDFSRFTLSVPSDGKRGGTAGRVMRHYPMVNPGWTINVKLLITDSLIDRDCFRQHVVAAGLFDGLGSFRKSMQGLNGIWKMEDFSMDVL